MKPFWGKCPTPNARNICSQSKQLRYGLKTLNIYHCCFFFFKTLHSSVNDLIVSLVSKPHNPKTSFHVLKTTNNPAGINTLTIFQWKNCPFIHIIALDSSKCEWKVKIRCIWTRTFGQQSHLLGINGRLDKQLTR